MKKSNFWQLLIVIWFSAVIILFAVGIFALPIWGDSDSVGVVADSNVSETPVLSLKQLQSATKLIDDRQAAFESLKAAPPKFVDPSL